MRINWDINFWTIFTTLGADIFELHLIRIKIAKSQKLSSFLYCNYGQFFVDVFEEGINSEISSLYQVFCHEFLFSFWHKWQWHSKPYKVLRISCLSSKVVTDTSGDDSSKWNKYMENLKIIVRYTFDIYNSVRLEWAWLSGLNLGLPSGSPGFESDHRTEISSYGLRDLNQFYHIGSHNTATGETITPA